MIRYVSIHRDGLSKVEAWVWSIAYHHPGQRPNVANGHGYASQSAAAADAFFMAWLLQYA